MDVVTVHYIKANQLKSGYVIVSAFHDWEPDGRLKPGDPFHVKTAKREYGGNSPLEAFSVTSRAGKHRTYLSTEWVAVEYQPIEGTDLNAIAEAIEVLTRYGYADEANTIKTTVAEHNSPPVKSEAPTVPPLPPAQGLPTLAKVEIPLPPEQAAPPSPFVQ